MLNKEEKPKYLLIDALNLAFRAWWPCREFKNSRGEPTGLEYGFIRNLLTLQRIWQPAKIILVWDGQPSKAPGFVSDGQYKANRDHTLHNKENFYGRAEVLREKLRTLVGTAYHPYVEADYFVASLSHKLAKLGEAITQDYAIYLFSNDTDWLGLVDDSFKIRVIKPGTKTDGDKIYDESAVKEEYGVTPDTLALYRAFSGDASDNLPGLFRVPTKFKLTSVESVTKNGLTLPVESQIDIVLGWVGLNGNEGQIQKYNQFREQAIKNYKIMDLRKKRDEPMLSKPEGCKPIFEVPGKTDRAELMRWIKDDIEAVSLINRKEWELFPTEWTLG